MAPFWHSSRQSCRIEIPYAGKGPSHPTVSGCLGQEAPIPGALQDADALHQGKWAPDLPGSPDSPLGPSWDSGVPNRLGYQGRTCIHRLDVTGRLSPARKPSHFFQLSGKVGRHPPLAINGTETGVNAGPPRSRCTPQVLIAVGLLSPSSSTSPPHEPSRQ